MISTAPSRRRIRASIVCALVLVLGASISVARASRQKTTPYRYRCTIAAPDVDRDRIPDCWERKNGLDPSVHDADSDLDRDGLSAIEEFALDVGVGRGPLVPYRASVRDSDGDGIADGDEDIDGDGRSNAFEIRQGSDALDASDPAVAARTASSTDGTKPAPSPETTKPPAPSPTGPPASPTPRPPKTHTPPPPTPSPSPSPSPTPGPVCASPPDSIAADGSRDVRAEMQAFIDGVPDGACITLPAGARYRVDDTLYLRERHDLTINAAGATVFTDTLDPFNVTGKGAGRSDRRQVMILGGSNITIDGLTVDGPDPSGAYDPNREAEAGVAVHGTQGAMLRNLTIREVYGDFLVISEYTPVPGSGVNVPARDVTVTGGYFETAGRQGIAMSGDSVNTTIDGNWFRDMSRSGIDIELLPGRAVTNVRVTNNVFQDFGLNWIAMGGKSSVSGAYFGYNRVLGDTLRLKAGAEAGVTTVMHQYLTYEGNSSDTLAAGSGALFSFRYVNHVVIRGNVQHFAPGTHGAVVLADGGCDYTVEGNDFAGMVALFAEPPLACPA